MTADENLAHEIAEEVWRKLACNGSLHIDIDTDVQCYGPWDPHGHAPYDSSEGRVQDAQNWVEYFVRSTLNRLNDRHLHIVAMGAIPSPEPPPLADQT